MNKSEKKRILKEAVTIAEKAYRRGFQHGITYSENYNITDDDASKFRFHVSYNRAYGAPERDDTGKIRNPWRGINHHLIDRHIYMENGGKAPTLKEMADEVFKDK